MAGSLAHHLLLVIAVAALGGAGWRGAGAVGADGLERIVAAAPLAVAVAVVSSLGLGLVGLGGSAVLLCLIAVLAWVATRLAIPESPARPLLSGLAAGWGRLTRRQRYLLGALVGVFAAWATWLVKHPVLLIDPLTYHLPEVVRWVREGSPGTVEPITYDWPVGNYPLANEVVLAWLTAIGRSFSPALLWTLGTGLLTTAAAWLGLSRAAVPRLPAGLAIAAVLAIPVSVTQLLGPHTDLPALCWLIVTAALVSGATQNPRLLLPGLVAAGLAVGTKTTVAPLVLVVLALGIYGVRSELRRYRGLVIAGALLGAACALPWYVRNLIEHGSPLWPFVATPGADPLPPLFERLSASFLDRPRATVQGRADVYLDLLGGGLLLLAAALPAAVFAGARAAVLSAVLALGALLAWLNAPFTGAPTDPVIDVSLTTTRYLLPAVSVAALALALAARDASPRRRRIATSLIGAAALLSIERSLALPAPAMPSLTWLVAGVVGGAAAVALVSRALARIRPRPVAAWWRWPAAATGSVMCAAALAVAGDDLGRRHAGAARLATSGVVAWVAHQPSFQDGDDPVAFAPQMIALLAGDRLEHSIELIPRTETCPAVLARADAGWVVIGTFPFADRTQPFTAKRCLEDRTPVYDDGTYQVYSGLRGRGAP